MTKEELAQLVLHQLYLASEITSVSLVEDGLVGNPVIGVEAQDGTGFFVEVQDA